jgi:D-alanine-D-alanine ligase
MKYGIIFGGQSFEHEISIVSAITLKNKLQLDLSFIFLDKDRNFYLIDAKNMKSNYFSSYKYKEQKQLFLKHNGFFKEGFFKEKKVDLDVMINLVHGRDGEDAKLASLFEFFQIPFIGPRIEASVISFNKQLTKTYAKERGVKTLEYQVISREKEFNLNLNFPIIIKPLRLGSSIGVSVVKEQKELDYALDVAYEFDKEILIEPFIKDVNEFNLAGFFAKDRFYFSIIEKPEKKEFLDFEKKYLDFSRTNEIKEAQISDYLKQKIKDSFKKIYSNMFEGALIRCDFFVIDNEIYLNEINPIPGSMANYLFDNFEYNLQNLAQCLPKEKKIDINYSYINQIQLSKGK